MLFGVMRILAKEIYGELEEEKHRQNEYDDGEQRQIEELLHAPMTLAQGAKIMNDIIRKRDGDRLITEERTPSPFAPRLIKNEGKPYERDRRILCLKK